VSRRNDRSRAAGERPRPAAFPGRHNWGMEDVPMTDPEPASPPCQAPPGYWDADEEPPPAAEPETEQPAPKAGDE
jgi:hypothetical protein